MTYMFADLPPPGMAESLAEPERAELFADVGRIMAELTGSGELVGGQALADPSAARTVRAAG